VSSAGFVYVGGKAESWFAGRSDDHELTCAYALEEEVGEPTWFV
jgi:hypothetical protein